MCILITSVYSSMTCAHHGRLRKERVGTGHGGLGNERSTRGATRGVLGACGRFLGDTMDGTRSHRSQNGDPP